MERVIQENMKTIQPMETSVVKQIHVEDGQTVKSGDRIIEFDATATGADTKRLENDLTVARLQSAGAEGFLKGMDGEEPSLYEVPGIDEDRLEYERRLLASQWQEYKAKLERIEADIASKEAEERSTREVVNKLERTLPIVQHRAEVFKKLFDEEVVSEQQYRDQEKTLIELEGDLAATSERLSSIQAALLDATKQRASLVAETRRTILDGQREAEQKVTINTQELIKA